MALAFNANALNELERPDYKKPGGSFNDVIRCFVNTGDPYGWHTYYVLATVLLSFLPTISEADDYTNYIRQIVKRWNKLAAANRFGTVHGQVFGGDGCVLSGHHRICERPSQLRRSGCKKGRFLKEFRLEPRFVTEALSRVPHSVLDPRLATLVRMSMKRDAPQRRRESGHGKRRKSSSLTSPAAPLSPSHTIPDVDGELDKISNAAATERTVLVETNVQTETIDNSLPSAHLDRLQEFSHLAYLGMEDLGLSLEGDPYGNGFDSVTHVAVPNDDESNAQFQEEYERFLQAAPDVPIDILNVNELDFDAMFADPPLFHTITNETCQYDALAAIDSLVISNKLTHALDTTHNVANALESLNTLDTLATVNTPLENELQPELTENIIYDTDGLLHDLHDLAKLYDENLPVTGSQDPVPPQQQPEKPEQDELETDSPSPAQKLLDQMIAAYRSPL